MKKMKKHIDRKKPVIALITNHDDDVYCFRRELIEYMDRAGYNILISCPYGEKLDLMKNLKFKYDNVYIDRRGTNPICDLGLFIHYFRMMKQYRPDVVLTYTIKPNIYASLAAACLKIPYINNITGLGSVLGMKGIMQALVMNLFKISFKKSSYVFFQNNENKKLAIKKGLISGEYGVIPGSGVNTDRFPLQSYPEGGNGIEGEKIIFNYIGRVLHDKGIDDYIEAAKRIKSKYPNTEFNIIGFIEPTEKHYKRELKVLEESGIVVYHGQQKDVKPFIKKSHVTIHPSMYGEGMSNVLLESASCGRVLITTDNTGCKEAVNDGETGFIYHGGKVDELVEKIEQFLNLDNQIRRRMGMAGRKKMKKEFSRNIVVEAYLERIKCLVK